MKRNFDELIDRRVSECKKYEPSYPKDVIPMWIADTDFAVPEEIAEAIQKRAEHPCFGYPVESFEFERAAARWEKVRFGWEVDPEWVKYSNGVLPFLMYAIRAFAYPGDKVVIQPPVYPPFQAITKNNGCQLLTNPLIQDENGKVLKTYEKAGVYVTGCSMNENQIILDRVEKDGEGNFVPCENDQIVSGVVDVQRSNKIITIPLEEYKNITEIQMKSDLDGKKLKFLTPKEVLYEGSREIQIPQSQIAEESYYVYSPGGEVTIMSAAGEAINLANDIAGTVMGESGAYIWRRGRLNVKNQIMAIEGVPVTEEKNSLAVCLDSLFSYEGIMRNSEYLLAQGKTVQEVLEENLDGMQVLDLSGCSLESVLYYPDREIPVLAILGDGNAVLIIGFNEKNVVLMNPEMGSVYKMGMNEAAQWFEETGCHFLSYVKK